MKYKEGDVVTSNIKLILNLGEDPHNLLPIGTRLVLEVRNRSSGRWSAFVDGDKSTWVHGVGEECFGKDMLATLKDRLGGY